uniref:Uncharacterized protein n=1 Tax=Solanum lycopersicum TaxID=4081 RepID=A0A3Q7I2Q8_SOLLC
MVRRKLVESCVKELNFCATERRGELQDSVPNKSKGIEDELIIKLKSSIIEFDVCALNKLKRRTKTTLHLCKLVIIVVGKLVATDAVPKVSKAWGLPFPKIMDLALVFPHWSQPCSITNLQTVLEYCCQEIDLSLANN